MVENVSVDYSLAPENKSAWIYRLDYIKKEGDHRVGFSSLFRTKAELEAEMDRIRTTHEVVQLVIQYPNGLHVFPTLKNGGVPN